MSNLSYCRFQNTLKVLLDCQEHIEDGNFSSEEIVAREQLIEVCSEITDLMREFEDGE